MIQSNPNPIQSNPIQSNPIQSNPIRFNEIKYWVRFSHSNPNPNIRTSATFVRPNWNDSQVYVSSRNCRGEWATSHTQFSTSHSCGVTLALKQGPLSQSACVNNGFRWRHKVRHCSAIYKCCFPRSSVGESIVRTDTLLNQKANTKTMTFSAIRTSCPWLIFKNQPTNQPNKQTNIGAE